MNFFVNVTATSPTTVTAPAVVTANVAITPVDGFAQGVGFAIEPGLPPGITANVTPSMLPGPGSAALTVNVAPGTPAGTYPVVVRADGGTDPGTGVPLVHVAALPVTVTAPPTPPAPAAPPFSRPISSVYPDEPLQTCLIGQFSGALSTPVGGTSPAHRWYVKAKANGPLEIVLSSHTVNTAESGFLRVTLFDAAGTPVGSTLLGFDTSAPGATLSGTVATAAVAGAVYRVEVARIEGSPAAHHYTLHFNGIPVDVGVSTPTQDAFEGGTSVWHVNVAAGETALLRFRNPVNPTVSGSEAVRVYDGTTLVASTATTPNPFDLAVPLAAADRTLTVIVDADDHWGVVKASGTDRGLYVDTCHQNRPPGLLVGPTAVVPEGSSATVTATATADAFPGEVSLSWDVDGDGSFETPGGSVTVPVLDGPSVRKIQVQAVDAFGATTTRGANIRGINVAPSLASIAGPSAPVAAGAAVTLSSAFTDPGVLDTHTGSWAWDDSTSSAAAIAETAGNGTATGTHAFAEAGVYSVTLTVTDKDGGSDSETFTVIVTSGEGFLTGGGWIDSAAGGLAADASATGRVTFGLVSKYLPGRALPTGETELQFRVGSLNFHSTGYAWLVVSGGKAQYRGTGTVNGGGSYGFLLTAYDGDRAGGDGIDRLRMKIWNAGSGALVYDNVPGAPDDIDTADPQPLGSGSIVIHR